jgi:uncharacterized protein (TIGR02284 family)
METNYNNKTVETLNKLVEINNDRIEGYETASQETDDQELKYLFSQLIQTSQSFNQELTREIYSLGGSPTEDTKITGKFFRVWMDVKAALAGKDRKAILSSCEFGEDHAIKTYEKVLEDDLANLSFEQHGIIRSQYLLLKADHDKVRSMRDVYV